MTFGEKLRELRLQKELSMRQVAEAININERTYNHYELGDREPSLEMLKAICDFYDISADYLIGRTELY